MSWVEGAYRSYRVSWTSISAVVPVSTIQELISAKFTVASEGMTDGLYFDEFVVQRDRTSEKIFGSELVFYPLTYVNTVDAFEFPVMGITKDTTVKAVYLVPKMGITGNENNYMQLNLLNKKTGGVIASKTFVAGIDGEAWKTVPFGPVNPGHAELTHDDSISIQMLQFGGGMVLPPSTLVVEWNLTGEEEEEQEEEGGEF